MINPNKGNSQLNTLVGMIDNALSRISTAMPVQVINVDEVNHTVDVMPMVTMIDNEGKAVDHAPISGLPYARLQAGKYGLVVNPQKGDKGVAVFASRDISNVVENKEKSIPASYRKHSMSDGIYIASLLYEEPKTYIKIEDDLVTITATNVQINGDVTIDGNVKITKDLKIDQNVDIGMNTNMIMNLTVGQLATIMQDATINGISFKDHIHKLKNSVTDKPENK